MVISRPAMVCLEAGGARLARVGRWLMPRRVLGRRVSGRDGDGPVGAATAADGAIRREPRAEPDAEPAGLVATAEPIAVEPGLTAAERRARAAALRAMLLARRRRYAAAEAAFAEAAGLDPALDPAGEPGFWDLPRGGQEAAVRAYVGLGREREAAMLGARLRHRYRPRPLPASATATTAER
jgi:hypothetical protein